MKGDFSRLTFDVTKHFSRVLMQQGRVQLDADWNEQTAILLHYLQTLAKDLIGEHGGPRDNLSFEITPIDKVSNDFQIGSGHYYVDGILVEQETNLISIEIGNNHDQIKVSALTINEAKLKIGQYLEVSNENETKVVKITAIVPEKLSLTVDPSFNTSGAAFARRVVTYRSQEDYPSSTSIEQNKTYLVYLDVWERHVAYIEDDKIREVALGGPDTATRAKMVWQVKITDKQPDAIKELKDVTLDGNDWREWVYEKGKNRWSDWKNQWQPANRGLLKAQAKQDRKKDDEPCITSPESSYRGAENQLYRVEIHQGGEAWDGKSMKEGKATFKWSRDNGSVVTGVKLSGTELTVDNPRGLSEGKWLELTNDNQELRGYPGLLIQIKRIECDTIMLDITGAINPPDDVPQGEVWPTKARLWESDQITILESNGNTDKDWHKLEYGVQIQFQPSNPINHYRTGDYWLIPARVATGDVEWPGEEGKPEALPPHGIEHHYAPLAIIKITATEVTKEAELRKEFEPSAKDIP